jgi:hypothetical protein
MDYRWTILLVTACKDTNFSGRKRKQKHKNCVIALKNNDCYLSYRKSAMRIIPKDALLARKKGIPLQMYLSVDILIAIS